MRWAAAARRLLCAAASVGCRRAGVESPRGRVQNSTEVRPIRRESAESGCFGLVLVEFCTQRPRRRGGYRTSVPGEAAASPGFGNASRM